MNKRGIALILSFTIIAVLLILGAAVLSRSISERAVAQRYAESTQSFWLAEAGINRALEELRSSYSITGTNLFLTPLGPGEYSVDIQANGQARDVFAHGYVPSQSAPRSERVIRAVMNKYIPPNFYDNAIYSGGEVDFNGNAYSVSGDVIYADIIDNTGNVTGDITQDPSISPLARLDFQQLLGISQSQGNVYIEQNNKLVNQQTGLEGFPVSFWYSEGVANVVYVLSDLKLNGDIGTIGGFFVVVGDVITNPDGEYDATINGNGQIDGVIYTRGEFKVNGGGGGLNVDGGVWAGNEAELNGNATVNYNQGYMDAIKNLGINAEVQIISWKDAQNPYYLAP